MYNNTNTGTRAVKWGSLKSYWLIPSWVRIPPSVFFCINKIETYFIHIFLSNYPHTLFKMMHPLELHEIDFADEDTPRATHCAIVKVWNGERWVDCDKIDPVDQVIYEEPEEEDEEYSITSKADKRRREKGTNFAYKKRTNIYIKN